MVVAKVIRIKGTKRSRDKQYYSHKGGAGAEDLAGRAIIPEALAPIERLMRKDLPKALVTLTWIANRNKDGVSPKEWYEFMCEALGIESTDSSQGHDLLYGEQ